MWIEPLQNGVENVNSIHWPTCSWVAHFEICWSTCTVSACICVWYP